MRIELERCVLRSWQSDDAHALAKAANNRNVWLTLRDLMPHPYTIEDAEAYLRRVAEEGPKQSLCIEVDGKAAGAISLRFESDVHRLTAELGYWLAEEFWGRGVMTEAVSGLVDACVQQFSAAPNLRLRLREQSRIGASLGKNRLHLRRPDATKRNQGRPDSRFAALRASSRRNRADIVTGKTKWRSRAKAALESYFYRRSFPRITLTLLLLITGAAGFLISYGMLRAGVLHMWIRYPVAVLVSYALLLGLIRIWVEIERARFDPLDADIEGTSVDCDGPRFASLRGSDGSWFDWLDLPSPDLDWGEGCLAAIVLMVLVGLVLVLVTTIAAAPTLIAEVFLDAFIVTVLYRRLRVAQKEHWLGTALRKTIGRALLTALLLGIGGWALEMMAPGAHSIGKAIEQIRSG